MSINVSISSILVASLISALSFAQTTTPPVERVAFVLKNGLGYHRMFRAEGPGMAYGFSMNRNEKTPKNWPVGSRLYFSRDGEDRGALILTVLAEDAGKTLSTDPNIVTAKADLVEKSKEPTVTVGLRNNSLLLRKVSLISYVPGEDFNGTTIFRLLPYSVSRRRFPVGTKLYLANDQQVGVVMSGQRIDSDKPFLVVKPEDNGRTFDLFD